MRTVTFLGTGDFLAGDRYWNSFVIDGRYLIEPSPTALPHLRRSGISAGDIEVIAISHFHADHTFGWPFLLLELVRSHRQTPLWIVGPPGVRDHLADMMSLGGVEVVHEQARERLDLRYVEVDGTHQEAGPLRFRAVEVEHVPHLRCFGFAFDLGGLILGYSGDTRPCGGLDDLAASSQVLVLECNGPHPPPQTHMDVKDVAALREAFPNTRLVLTHLGGRLRVDGIDNSIVPADFDTIDVADWLEGKDTV